ncbi:DUF2971 domain-containing protein [Parvibaculum sp.]|uniref:DUF2971 domain-containing protein n=1 Tax=Parvibaculum sp. TaxID=2024848 RepID=UPI003BAD34C4
MTTLADINDPFEFRAIGTEDKSLRRSLEDWRNDLPASLGFVSFCHNRTNPVIWSHYADGYRGICLGFDVDDLYLYPVRYVTERVIMSEEEFSSALTDRSSKEISSLLATKFAHWEYESEKRVFYGLNEDEVIRDNGLYFAPFDDMFSLREIILGPNYDPISDTSLKKELRRVVSSVKGCSVKTARTAFKTFDIVFQQDKRKQKSF